MTPDASAAFTFTDFNGLAALRREAGRQTPEATRAVAQQLESLFLGLVLKEMRTAGTIEGGLFDGEGVELYRDLHDRQLALALSSGRGIGLADAIVRELGGEPARGAGGSRAPEGTAGDPSLGRRIDRFGPAAGSAANAAAASAAVNPPAIERAAPDGPLAESPEAFVAALRPHAERAAAALGTSADVLIAQAALETGWGRHVIRGNDGRSTFNLFGIKAAGGWHGSRATVATLEFVGGLPERRREAFRAYGSVGESFDDYVALVQGSARYRDALAAETPEEYAKALADGGYSTDPRYADKILEILDRGLPGVALKPAPGSADTERTARHPTDDAHRGGST